MACDTEQRPYHEKWDKVKLISRGEFGEEVHEVLTDTKVKCAAKTIRLPIFEQQKSSHADSVNSTMISTKQLCSLRHENIMRFYEIKLKESESTVEVLMELITDKTLGEYVRHVPLVEDRARILIKQICDALSYLHSETQEKRCVVHRQINANTIVVSPDGMKAKLTDFGLAIMLVSAKAHHLSVLRGDTHYMAPELFLTHETEETLYSCASDIWAFGCVIFRMVSGNKPHSDCKNMLNIGRRIQIKGAPPLPENCSSVMKDFYAKCMAHKKEERKCAAELMKHPFIVYGPSQHEYTSFTGESAAKSSLCHSSQADLQDKVPPKRGICLVIDVQQYNDTAKFSSRPSAQEDTEYARIRRVFEALNFQVECPENTSSVEIWRSLQSAASASNCSKFDSFVCFFIAHGSGEVVYDSDGEEIDIREIVTSFRANRCPALKNKPKLFFIQTAEEKRSEGGSSSFQLREGDFLVCRSIMRHNEESFVQALCRVIEATTNRDSDIETLINEANRQLGHQSVKRGQIFCDSIPGAVSSLTEKFILQPKPMTTTDASPDKWSDEKLSDLCNLPENSSKMFGPMNQTLLMIASARGRKDLVEQLLKRESKTAPCVSAKDVQLRTAISLAAIGGHKDVLMVFEKAFENDLRALETEVNSQDSLGETPLILATMNHQTSVLKQLVRMKAKVNHQDFMEYSAVAYAAMEGFDDAVRELCELGADPKLADFSNNTPLIWAARGGHKSVIETLRCYLSNSADVEHWEAKGEEDMNAQEWAKMCGCNDCADCIQEFIRSLALPTAQPTTSSHESSGNNNHSGGSASGGTGAASFGGGGGGGSANQSESGSDGSGTGGGSSRESGTSRIVQLQYPLSNRGRRLAILINIVDFEHGCSLTRRDGSMEDMTEHGLYKCFRRLGFDIIKQYSNVGSAFFENMLATDSIREECKRAEVFLLCLMSHGEQGYIFACDGTRILLENVFEQFRRCDGLRDKPKIFIMQACRALESDRFTNKQAGQLNSGRHEDCLYVYSTFKLNISFRDGNTGGYFTRALRDTILRNFNLMSEDLPSGLTKVTRMVAEETRSQQIPVYKSTLRSLLRLPPKGMSTNPAQI